MTEQPTVPPALASEWFGPRSPYAVVATLFVNVTPVLAVPIIGVAALLILVPLELLAAAVLCRAGGNSREIGTGVTVAVVTGALVLVALAAATFVSENVC